VRRFLSLETPRCAGRLRRGNCRPAPPLVYRAMPAMPRLVHEIRPDMPRPHEPHLGFFWLFRGKVIIESIALSKAEPWGEFRNHPRSHFDHWTDLQRAGTVPSDMEYDEPPRGRVVYDPAHERFLLYADRCILRNKAALKRIMTALFLPMGRTTTSSDLHYRCARCAKRDASRGSAARGEDQES
jgi:hypothetical protein